MLSLGERLKNAREARKWTQDQLADHMNVTRVGQWDAEAADTKNVGQR